MYDKTVALHTTKTANGLVHKRVITAQNRFAWKSTTSQTQYTHKGVNWIQLRQTAEIPNITRCVKLGHNTDSSQSSKLQNLSHVLLSVNMSVRIVCSLHSAAE